MLPKIELFETKIGKFFLFDSDDFISQHLRKKGSWAEMESGIAVLISKHYPSSFILDIGANIGTFSIPVAKKLADKNIQIHAFEPQRIIFQQLNCNVFINQIENCYTHNIALGSRVGTINLPKIDYCKTKNIGAVSLIQEIQAESAVSYDSTQAEVVQVNTLDTLDTLDLSGDCSFIKIDVEGFESEVIEGSINFLQKNSFPSILFEEIPKGKFSDEINHSIAKRQIKVRRILENLGYKFICIGTEILAQHANTKIELGLIKSQDGNLKIIRIR